MEKLIIEGTKGLPEVCFDSNGRLYMSGASLPENPKEFFGPIMRWVENYKEEASMSTEIEFYFEYLNTASTYMILRLIETLTEIPDARSTVSLIWYYHEGDLEMKELGIEILENTRMKYAVIANDR